MSLHHKGELVQIMPSDKKKWLSFLIVGCGCIAKGLNGPLCELENYILSWNEKFTLWGFHTIRAHSKHFGLVYTRGAQNVNRTVMCHFVSPPPHPIWSLKSILRAKKEWAPPGLYIRSCESDYCSRVAKGKNRVRVKTWQNPHKLWLPGPVNNPCISWIARLKGKRWRVGL